MPADDRMNIHERRKYLVHTRVLYVQADRAERGWLLDEMEQVTELDCKSLVRLTKIEARTRRTHRSRTSVTRLK